jgi:uncharacterized membrane protein
MNGKSLPTNPSPSPDYGDPASSRATELASRFVVWIARHWLALFNTAWGLYVLLPFAAAVLMYAGIETPAWILYRVYSVLCHQLAGHSYFLFGPELTPSLATLEANGLPPGASLLEQRQFIGNALVGYKVAICERDIAIYGAVFLAGLAYALIRPRLRPLPLRWYLVALIPIAVDGLTQLFGLRESNWWLRTVTGAIFGIASVWLAYPYVDSAMQDVIETEQARRRQA